MSNPLMGMMGGGMSSGMGNMMGMFSQIRQFANLVGSRNPEQLVRNLMRQQGISDSELSQAMRDAQEIARQMGLK